MATVSAMLGKRAAATNATMPVVDAPTMPVLWFPWDFKNRIACQPLRQRTRTAGQLQHGHIPVQAFPDPIRDLSVKSGASRHSTVILSGPSVPEPPICCHGFSRVSGTFCKVILLRSKTQPLRHRVQTRTFRIKITARRPALL